MIRRKVTCQYQDSFPELLWTFINPILMLSIYTFVLSIAFTVRLNPQHHDKFAFALLIFIGLILFNLFSEFLSLASGLILSSVNHAKKAIFPLAILVAWANLSWFNKIRKGFADVL